MWLSQTIVNGANWIRAGRWMDDDRTETRQHACCIPIRTQFMHCDIFIAEMQDEPGIAKHAKTRLNHDFLK